MRFIRSKWRLLLSGVALSITLVACGDAQGNVSPSAPSGGADGKGATVNVAATEYAFSVDPAQASAGTITFVVKNDGTMPHDFAIEGNSVGQKTDLIAPGRSASLTVDLGAGTYNYACTVPGHAQLGMQGTFTIAP